MQPFLHVSVKYVLMGFLASCGCMDTLFPGYNSPWRRICKESFSCLRLYFCLYLCRHLYPFLSCPQGASSVSPIPPDGFGFFFGSLGAAFTLGAAPLGLRLWKMLDAFLTAFSFSRSILSSVVCLSMCLRTMSQKL